MSLHCKSINELNYTDHVSIFDKGSMFCNENKFINIYNIKNIYAFIFICQNY